MPNGIGSALDALSGATGTNLSFNSPGPTDPEQARSWRARMAWSYATRIVQVIASAVITIVALVMRS